MSLMVYTETSHMYILTHFLCAQSHMYILTHSYSHTLSDALLTRLLYILPPFLLYGVIRIFCAAHNKNLTVLAD